MPTYAESVRNELARIFDAEEELLRAELAGLLRFGSVEVSGRRDFSSINAAICRKVVTLTKKIFPGAKVEVAAVRTKKLRKSMKYFVRIFFAGAIEKFLHSLNSKNFTATVAQKISYLRGVFLACGSVNSPEKSYRIEISAPLESNAKFAAKIFRQLDFAAKIYVRGENFVAYFKEADSVCDFLAMIGAENAVVRFESARNLKEVRAQVNRLTNVELARINHAIEVSQRQLADIRLLRAENIPVNKILQETMEIREQFPECTIGALAEKLFVTRQAMNRRFKQIHELAEVLRGKV